MKNYFSSIIVIFLLLGNNFIYAQDSNITLDLKQGLEMQEAEIKSFQNIQAFEGVEYRSKKQIQGYNYDINYAKLFFKIDTGSNFIRGKVLFLIKKNSLTSIKLNLDSNLKINKIFWNGKSTSFNRINISEIEILTPINPNINYLNDSLMIDYSGYSNPSKRGLVQERHATGSTVWTLSEPYGAKLWWPCKESLIDKIDSFDIKIEIPNNCKAASNGKLISVKSSSKDSLVYHYHSNYPIDFYLICVTVSNYESFTQNIFNPRTKKTFPILSYFNPQSRTKWESDSIYNPQIMNNYFTFFKSYPFENEKYGNAEVSFNGGMEHQTFTSIKNLSFLVNAHELGHHWFGDKITCGSWKDIWLNEGFATFCEAMNYATLRPKSEFLEWKKNRTNSVFLKNAMRIYKYDTSNTGIIFDAPSSYHKPGMMLWMLKILMDGSNRVDTASSFFNVLNKYLNDTQFAYKTCTTQEFINFWDKKSNNKLIKPFLTDWIYKEGYPTFSYNYFIKDGNLQVYYRQTSSTNEPSNYILNVPIFIYSGGNKFETTLMLDKNEGFSEVGLGHILSNNFDSVVMNPEFDVLAKFVRDKSISGNSNEIVVSVSSVNRVRVRLNDEISRNIGFTFTIYDILGRSIYTADLTGKIYHETLWELLPGNYIWLLQQGTEKRTGKISATHGF